MKRCNPHDLISSRRTLIAKVAAGSLVAAMAAARAGGIEDAAAAVAALNPVSLAIDGMIDNAIDHGRDAVAEQLRHFQQIVDEALGTANTFAAQRESQLNDGVRDRLDQMKTTALLLDNAVRNSAEDVTGELNNAAKQRIRDLQTHLGQIVNDLAILGPGRPVLNEGALSVYLQRGETTVVTLTGIDLLKGGLLPRAYLIDPINPIAKVRLNILNSSNVSFDVEVPNYLVKPRGVSRFSLAVELSNGRHFESLAGYLPESLNVRPYTQSRLELAVGVLDRISVDASLVAKGQVFERIAIPQSTASKDGTAYVDAGQGQHPNYVDIHPVPSFGDYSVDTGAGYQGLTMDKCQGDGEWSCTFANGSLRLWTSAEHRDRGSHVAASGILSHLRRMKQVEQCSSNIQSTHANLLYSEVVQIKFDPVVATGPCSEPGLSAVPELETKIIIHRPEKQDFQLSVPDGHRVKGPDGIVVESRGGVVTFALAPTFHFERQLAVAGTISPTPEAPRHKEAKEDNVAIARREA